MFTPDTQQELFELLKSAQTDKVAYTPDKYRYVIYVRKSTDETGKQIRSIQDQISECVDFADKNGLKFTDIIDEAESAKEPDIRPKFKKMLVDVNTGKYHGIIAWHPDRLARNMREAGEVIDLVDKDIIKDLKFVSFTFNNDPSGKLLLGITFALSKEYSDKLSVNVKRGNRLSLSEGKYINTSKHGYIKDVNGYLRPDGANFVLLKEAFQMRLRGVTLEEISDYLVANSYYHRNTITSEPYYKMSKQKLQGVLKDPVYTGVLQYGSDVVKLGDYYDFIPMVTVAEFMQINKLSDKSDIIKLAKSYKKGDDVKANLLRDMVICSDCGDSMTAGITAKKSTNGNVTRYFYYRCDTEGCEKYGKSVRAKVIIDYVIELFSKKPFSTKKSYDHYKQEIKKVNAERVKVANQKRFALHSEKIKVEAKLEKTKELLMSDVETESVKKHYRGDLLKAENRLAEIEKEYTKTKAVIENEKVNILTQEKFIELMDKMPETLGSLRNLEELDFFLKKMFLNFTIKNKNVDKSTFCSPFDVLADTNVLNGARERT